MEGDHEISEMQHNSKRSVLSKGSVDMYAVQCKDCKKWRVFDSEDEFEEIRYNIIQDPFYCNKKVNCSCDVPADVEYDSSRTWVLDKPNLPKTPKGFKRRFELRDDYSKMRSYYVTPTDKKLSNEVAVFFEDHPEFEGVTSTDFIFSSPKIMQDTIPEMVEGKDSGKKAKIAEDDI